jgi:hypothetical protein
MARVLNELDRGCKPAQITSSFAPSPLALADRDRREALRPAKSKVTPSALQRLMKRYLAPLRRGLSLCPTPVTEYQIRLWPSEPFYRVPLSQCFRA